MYHTGQRWILKKDLVIHTWAPVHCFFFLFVATKYRAWRCWWMELIPDYVRSVKSRHCTVCFMNTSILSWCSQSPFSSCWCIWKKFSLPIVSFPSHREHNLFCVWFGFLEYLLVRLGYARPLIVQTTIFEINISSSTDTESKQIEHRLPVTDAWKT